MAADIRVRSESFFAVGHKNLRARLVLVSIITRDKVKEDISQNFLVEL